MADNIPDNPRLITFGEAQQRYAGGDRVIDLGIVTGADVFAEGGVKTLIPFTAGRMIKEVGYFPGDYTTDPDLEIVFASPNVGNPLYGWGAIPNTGDPLTDTVGNVVGDNAIMANGKQSGDEGHGMIMDTTPLVAALIKVQEPGIMAFLPAREWVANTGFVNGEWLIDSNGNIQVNLTGAGGVSGGTEPVWNTTPENSTSDGTITWYCYAPPIHQVHAWAVVVDLPGVELKVPASMEWITQPIETIAGATITPSPQVRVLDQHGDPYTFPNPITTVFPSIIGPGTLTSAFVTMENNVEGVVTFDNLSIAEAGTGYKLRIHFQGVGVPYIDSDPFDVTAP